jgi:hypothetical protein
MKRVLVLVLALMLAVPAPVNAASKKSLAKKTVKHYMKLCKKGELTGTGKNSKFSRLVRKYNKSLKYNIKSVKVSKNKAVVKVRVKYKSLYKAAKVAGYETGLYVFKKALAFEEVSDKQALNYFSKRVKKRVKKYPPKVKTKIIKFKLKYNKATSTWDTYKISDSSVHALLCDLLKGYVSGANQFAKDYNN